MINGTVYKDGKWHLSFHNLPINGQVYETALKRLYNESEILIEWSNL